jgi:hypothetical protein
MRTLFLASAVLTVLGASPGMAEEIYPWCVLEPSHSSYECRFTSYEQCRATAMGLGVCNRNPALSQNQVPASQVAPVQNSPAPVTPNPNGRKRTN